MISYTCIIFTIRTFYLIDYIMQYVNLLCDLHLDMQSGVFLATSRWNDDVSQVQPIRVFNFENPVRAAYPVLYTKY
jgi:hypothetical protein